MTADFRALCGEMIRAVDDASNAVDLVSDALNKRDFGHLIQECCDLIGAHDALLTRARAALAAAPAPVVGDAELVELAKGLRLISDGMSAVGHEPDSWFVARAADLLERGTTPAPVPVPVSERLPTPEDCDAEGRCWVHQPSDVSPEAPTWALLSCKYASANYGATAWLPAHTLPLPEVAP